LLEPGELRETLDDLLGNFEEPYDGEFLFLKAIFDAARKHGRKVLLDGAGGDVVLLEGTYINRLLRSGRLRLAMSEIAGKSRFWGTSVAPEVVRHFRSVLLPRTIKTRLRPLVDVRNRRQYLAHSLISREFADQIDINARFDQMRRTFHHEWEPDYATERCNAIRPAVTAGRERYARIAASIGMEARDPFLDKRVVDFCSRLPGHARIRNGWPKTILREVIADRLPDEVVWGRGKPHIGWTFNATATQLAVRGGTLELETLQNALAGYVDRGKLAKAWENFTARTNCEPIHTANVLSLWLRENANRPVVPDKPFG
jgi:asparagine synthase (glutamine-hydrolysing)